MRVSRPSRRGSSRRVARRVAPECGAAAVEMALVLPLLLLVVFGIIDLGRAYNAEIQLSQAAREGARLWAIGYSAADVQSRVVQAAGALAPTVSATAPSLVPCPAAPGPADAAVVVVSAPFTWITPIGRMASYFGPQNFPTPSTVTSRGVMQCGG